MATTAPRRSRKKRTSLLADLLQALPHLRPQLYFKPSLVALSHAMEDQVLSGEGQPLVFANFQRERYYRQEARRYQRIGSLARQVFVLAAPETDFIATKAAFHPVPLDPEDPLAEEWHLIVIDDTYASCLVCRERRIGDWQRPDANRQFEGIWSFDRRVAIRAAQELIPKILAYRADLVASLDPIQADLAAQQTRLAEAGVDPTPFVERLISYLQAGQYKLQRAYKAIQTREHKEHLINRIGTAIRRSLNPNDILQVAVQELGQAAGASRCLIYRCREDAVEATIEQEYRQLDQPSLLGQIWPLAANPLLVAAMRQRDPMASVDLAQVLPDQGWQGATIRAWLAIPVVYQGGLLGMLELHCDQAQDWEPLVLELGEAIALQVGAALIQAQAYQHLQDLNQQLEALDRAKGDLIAVTGHELRTPLSTIQVCLESLAGDPDMEPVARQSMLDIALQDTNRLRQLVQDFLTLSNLESGRIQWHIESLSAKECLELALSNLQARRRQQSLPTIHLDIPASLPLIRADGEWLVEVLRKLLDNACKFTPPTGQMVIRLRVASRLAADPSLNGSASRWVQFSITDTGRGIAPDRLQAIFERFYQVEGSLRRSVGGSGLGLAICRHIVEAMGGQIWAESAGEDQGSTFHFTLPVVAP